MDPLKNYTRFLGRMVQVKVDRPLGSKHPRHDFVYETNYGFIPYTKAGDGHEIDAYILDESTPLDSYTGICIAVIIRKNDDENKLVVSNTSFDSDSILKQVAFVEDHYDIEILMAEESA